MARCGCSSNQCNCVLVDGVNTTSSGAGTAASPYTVNVSNEAIQDAVGAALGCGLEYDDAGNQIRVNLSEQPGNTITCLADGLFSASGAVALGCGLELDGLGAIQVNTAGDFSTLTREECTDSADGDTFVALPGPDTAGMQIYCDSAGNLRTYPEKFTDTDIVGLNEGHVPNITVLPFTSAIITATITNPSDQYCMCGYVTFALIPAINGAPGTVINIDHERDMGNGIFLASTGYTMDNRGKSATASAGNYRMALPIPMCLDPGETKVVRHRVRYQRGSGDNGGAVTITATAHEIYWVGTNL